LLNNPEAELAYIRRLIASLESIRSKMKDKMYVRNLCVLHIKVMYLQPGLLQIRTLRILDGIFKEVERNPDDSSVPDLALPYLSSLGQDLRVWPDSWVSVEFLHAPNSRKKSGSTTPLDETFWW